MLDPNKIKKSQAKHILKLIDQATRAEVLSRIGRFDNLEFADWFKVKLETMDELLRYIYGTDSIVELAERWNMKTIGDKKKSSRRKRKGNKKKKL